LRCMFGVFHSRRNFPTAANALKSSRPKKPSATKTQQVKPTQKQMSKVKGRRKQHFEDGDPSNEIRFNREKAATAQSKSQGIGPSFTKMTNGSFKDHQVSWHRFITQHALFKPALFLMLLLPVLLFFAFRTSLNSTAMTEEEVRVNGSRRALSDSQAKLASETAPAAMNSLKREPGLREREEREAAERQRQERARQDQETVALSEKQEREVKERKEQEMREKQDRAAKERQQREAKEKQQREAREQQEREAKVNQEREATERQEREKQAKEQQKRESKERQEKQAQERQDQLKSQETQSQDQSSPAQAQTPQSTDQAQHPPQQQPQVDPSHARQLAEDRANEELQKKHIADEMQRRRAARTGMTSAGKPANLDKLHQEILQQKLRSAKTRAEESGKVELRKVMAAHGAAPHPPQHRA